MAWLPLAPGTTPSVLHLQIGVKDKVRVQVNPGDWPDPYVRRHRSKVVLYRRLEAPVPTGGRRGRHRVESPRRWSFFAGHVLNHWGPTLRLGLLLVLFTAAGATIILLVAQWAPVLGFILASVTSVGIGAVSGTLLSPRRSTGL